MANFQFFHNLIIINRCAKSSNALGLDLPYNWFFLEVKFHEWSTYVKLAEFMYLNKNQLYGILVMLGKDLENLLATLNSLYCCIPIFLPIFRILSYGWSHKGLQILQIRQLHIEDQYLILIYLDFHVLRKYLKWQFQM